MASYTDELRGKRMPNPKKIFSPSDSSTSILTHYLIYIPDTFSYSIVGKTSVKKIHGKSATLILNNKQFHGEIVVSGRFSDCQKELNKRQRLSQSHNGSCDEIEEGSDEIESSENEENDGFDQESDDDLIQQTGSSKKRKNFSSVNREDENRQHFKRSKNIEDINANGSTTTQSEICIRPRTDVDDRQISKNGDTLQMIANKMNNLGKNMLKINHAIRHMASKSSADGGKNLDRYRDKDNIDQYPSEIEFNGKDLIKTIAKDYGDFARRTMRLLFSSDELKSCILPPGRSYLTRPPLDSKRFELLNQAVRAKYRLSSHLYDDFFKFHLGPKLSDFLIEERRREAVRHARHLAKTVSMQTSNVSSMNENQTTQ